MNFEQVWSVSGRIIVRIFEWFGERSAWKMERKAFREYFSSFKLVGMLSSVVSSVRWVNVAQLSVFMHSTLLLPPTTQPSPHTPLAPSQSISTEGMLPRQFWWMHLSLYLRPLDWHRPSDKLRDSPWTDPARTLRQTHVLTIEQTLIRTTSQPVNAQIF